jgi:hypothetical protein
MAHIYTPYKMVVLRYPGDRDSGGEYDPNGFTTFDKSPAWESGGLWGIGFNQKAPLEFHGQWSGTFGEWLIENVSYNPGTGQYKYGSSLSDSASAWRYPFVDWITGHEDG